MHNNVCNIDSSWFQYIERLETLMRTRTNQMVIEEHSRRVMMEAEQELLQLEEKLNIVRNI